MRGSDITGRKGLVVLLAVGAATTAQGALGQGSGQPGAAVTTNQCVLKGTTHLPKDLTVYDQARGGQPIARFTGGKTTLTAKNFPTSSTVGRVAIQTGSGTGGFRINGFVEASKLPIFTVREVPVPGGVVWLGKARKVQFVSATSDKLKVKMKLTQPMRQTFTGKARCSAFTLSPGIPPGWAVPGNAIGYVVKKDLVDLYISPDKDSGGTTLRLAHGMLMWSEPKYRNGFVHLQYHGPVVIDAWARPSGFRRLPWGEREDRLAQPVTRPTAPRLQVAGTTQEVTTSAEVAIHTAPRADSPKIGAIEPGTQTYVLDIVVGWASVLPRSLNITPHGDSHFWAKASELGIGTN